MLLLPSRPGKKEKNKTSTSPAVHDYDELEGEM